MALIIKPGNEVMPVQPDDSGCFSLKLLQSIVEGYIEVVHIGNDEVAIVNEEGLLKGMQPNELATVYLNLRILYVGEEHMRNNLVGTVLFCKRNEIK